MSQAQINTMFELQQQMLKEFKIMQELIRDLVEKFALMQQQHNESKPAMTRGEALGILMGKLKEGEDSATNEGWMTVEESMALLGLAPV